MTNKNPLTIDLSQRSYSAEEVATIAVQVADQIAQHRQDDELRYSVSDVYWIIRSLFRYVNQRIHRGEFTLKRLKANTWKLEYNEKTLDERRADKRHQRSIEETKKLIERLTIR